MPAEINDSDDRNDNGHLPAELQDQPRISTETEPGTGRWLAIAIGVLVVILLIAFTIAFLVRQHGEDQARQATRDSADATPIVEVVPVQPTATGYPLQLPGETAGWDESPLFARVDGYVATWSADIGDHVKQGEVLATIETPELDQQLNAARAKAAASAAQIQVAQSGVAIAKLTDERWKDSPKGVVSEQEREQKSADYEEAVARLAAAKAQNQLDEADVSRFTAMEGFRNLTAPYDGIITRRNVNVGNLVSAGSSANGTMLYEMARFKTIRVFVYVPQKAAVDMIVGLGADVTSDQYPGRVFHGKVARSAMSIDPQTLTQRTEVDIANADLALIPGMRVEVTLQLNQRGLLEVPAAAILFRPGGLQVAVVDSAGKVNFYPITIARDNGDTVVLASGVKGNDKVALNLSSAITPGEQVTAKQDDQAIPKTPSPQPAPTVETTGATPAQHPPQKDATHSAEQEP